MIDLHYNFPLLPSQVPEWQERLRAAVEANAASGLRALQPSFKGSADGQRAIAAAWLGEQVDDVFLTSGGHHGCMVVLLAAGLVGKTVAVEEFTYAGFKDQARMLGIRLVPCKVDRDGLMPEAFREACARERAETTPIAALFTMPTVHNPLGCTLPLRRREEVIAIAREFDLLILEDDAYAYLDDAPPPTLRSLAPERTFYVCGLSKSLAPAARTGFLAAPSGAGAAVAGAIRQTSTGVSNLLTGAACAMVEDGSFDALLAAKRAEGKRRNAEARRVLGPVCGPGVPSAWHLWLPLPEGVISQTFEGGASAAGVAVSGGHWSAAGYGLPQGIRVSLGGEAEWSRVCQGLEIVAGEMASLG